MCAFFQACLRASALVSPRAYSIRDSPLGVEQAARVGGCVGVVCGCADCVCTIAGNGIGEIGCGRVAGLADDVNAQLMCLHLAGAYADVVVACVWCGCGGVVMMRGWGGVVSRESRV